MYYVRFETIGKEFLACGMVQSEHEMLPPSFGHMVSEVQDVLLWLSFLFGFICRGWVGLASDPSWPHGFKSHNNQ